MDTYILLSSWEAIPNPDALAFEGVRRGGKGPAPKTPLAQLLYGMSSEERGAASKTPINWSIERLSLKSEPAPK